MIAGIVLATGFLSGCGSEKEIPVETAPVIKTVEYPMAQLELSSRNSLPEFYIVQRGDILDSIAIKKYGTAAASSAVYGLNTELGNLSKRTHTIVGPTGRNVVEYHQFLESYLGAGDTLTIPQPLIAGDSVYNRVIPPEIIEQEMARFRDEQRALLWKNQRIDSIVFKMPGERDKRLGG